MQKTLRISYSFAQFKRTKLKVFDGLGDSSYSVSGIKSTIYGGTGFMGPYIGAALGMIGSDLVFPHRHMFQFVDEVKELKLCAPPGKAVTLRNMDYDNLEQIDWTMEKSNVVINLLGPRRNCKDRNEFEYINIEVPKRIARACAKNPNVLRFIHFSSAGARANSDSLDLQTKFFGEQEVLNEFPNATIFRPCTVVGLNDQFVNRWLIQKEYLYNFNIVWDDCKARRQPILVRDVALSVLNALKLHETAGKTYELGGPHVYSLLEVYEILHNYIERPPHLVHFPKALAISLARLLPNWTHFNTDMVQKHGCDIITTPTYRQIDELYVRPVSFPSMLPAILSGYSRRPQLQRSLDER